MFDKLYKRSVDPHLLSSDSSISQLASFDFANWPFIHQCYKSVSSLPLNLFSKKYLKNYLLSDYGLQLLEIKHPFILLFRFPNGEVRSFVTSQSGFLLEHPENHLWDNCFSFLEHREDLVYFNLPRNLPVFELESSFLFARHSSNYSHFLLDFWALLAALESVCQFEGSFPSEIPIFESPVAWQKEYFDSLDQFQPRYFDQLFKQANAPLIIFRPTSIYLPVFENKSLSLLIANSFLHQSCLKRFSFSKTSALTGKIIFLTRNDARRARIKNIDAIESLVVSMGGHVIDPLMFSVSERIKLFSKPSVFIAESSGCMNFALFAHESSRLISLLEPSSLDSVDLLVGGWIYNLGFSARTDYVVGSSRESLSGSPLGSAQFSLEQIHECISANLDII